MHDIHANQGNDPGHKKDDGVWQDGGVLIHYPKTNQWVGIFLRFQSQSWHTDDVTGHAFRPPTTRTASCASWRRWSTRDKQKKKMPLSGSIAAGAALHITVKKPMELSNKGRIRRWTIVF